MPAAAREALPTCLGTEELVPGFAWEGLVTPPPCDQWRGRFVPARLHRNGHGGTPPCIPAVRARLRLAAIRRGVTPCQRGLANAAAGLPPPPPCYYNGTLSKSLLHCATFIPWVTYVTHLCAQRSSVVFWLLTLTF